MKTSSFFLSTDVLEEFIKNLFPQGSCLQVNHLEITAEEITCVALSTHPQGLCPLCGEASSRVHSRYARALQDLPCSGVRLRLRLQVRRFFCANPTCPRRIFSERLPALTEAFARRTNRLRDALLEIGWVLGGEAGARLCRKQGMPVCAATLLTLLRRAGVQAFPTPRVLGVDDWGFQREHPTGTLLVDLEKHQVVEVLLGSDEEVLAQWLEEHPGVEVIARDRGAGYRKAVTKAEPPVQEILDRWHLVKNLGEVLQKALAQQIAVLRQAATESAASPGGSAPPIPARTHSKPRKPPRRKEPTLRPQRVWQLSTFEQVRQLAASGWAQSAIAQQLHIHPHTVSKYLRMDHFVDRRHNPHGSSVEPYRAYLQERWAQGCRMIKQLWYELQMQGFTGSYQSVWNFTRFWPTTPSAEMTVSAPAKCAQSPRTPLQAKWLLLKPPEELSARDAAYREALCRLSPS